MTADFAEASDRPDLSDAAAGLPRTLTTVDIVLLAVGTVIGSGIFLVPSLVVRAAGTVGVALAIGVAAGVLSLLGALT